MTRKKVGGRESGKPSGQSRVEESGGVPAAANPAARPICFCNGNFYESRAQYYLKEAIWLHEHIRALEESTLRMVGNARDLRTRAEKAEAANKELSAMLYELRSQRDYAIAIQEDRER